MRSQKQIESQLADVKRQIIEKQNLQSIAMFPGSDKLLAMFRETHDLYDATIHALDPNNPALNINFATNKACLALVDKWISGMTDADVDVEELKKRFLNLNGELQDVMDDMARREKNRM